MCRKGDVSFWNGLDPRRGPVRACARVCICEHTPRYTGMSEQVKGFRSMLEKQQLNCCLARKGLGGAGWGRGTGLVAGPGTIKRRKEQMHSCGLGRQSWDPQRESPGRQA